MSWVEEMYAERMMYSYDQYKKASANPFRLNCRCPVCGDSQKDKYKARFWVYYPKGADALAVNCFNCGYSARFTWFLKTHDEVLYREFLMENRKATIAKPNKEPDLEKFKSKTVIKSIPKLLKSTRLDQLPETHPIVKYVKKRQIPKDKWNRLWFTSHWKELVNSVKPDTYKTIDKDEPRLVIPIYDEHSNLICFQGRALSNTAKQKYITIKASEDASKVYGLDTAVSDRSVIILEGPIDTLFLDNAIAITGGSLNLDEVPFKDDRIWVMDNEPRASDTLKRIMKLIDQGETVLIWDKSRFTSKDINDMIIKENATKEELMEYITKYSCKGLLAKHRLMKYAKVDFNV